MSSLTGYEAGSAEFDVFDFRGIGAMAIVKSTNL